MLEAACMCFSDYHAACVPGLTCASCFFVFGAHAPAVTFALHNSGHATLCWTCHPMLDMPPHAASAPLGALLHSTGRQQPKHGYLAHKAKPLLPAPAHPCSATLSSVPFEEWLGP